MLRPASAATEELSLRQALTAAMAEATSVRTSRLELRKAEHAYREAATRRLPSVQVQGSASYLTNPPGGITIRKGDLGFAPAVGSEAPVAVPDQDFVLMEDPEDTYFQLQATLSQPLFTWGKIRRGVEAARAGRRAAGADLRTAERELRRDVRLSYYGAVLARDSADVLREAEATLGEMLADRRRSFDEGLINKQEVLEARSTMYQVRTRRIESHEAYRTAVAALEFYTNRSLSKSTLTSGLPTKALAATDSVLVEAARRTSPELEALAARVEQAQLRVAIQERSEPLRPDFSVNVSLDVSGQRIPVVGANWTDSWDTNLVLSIGTNSSLFDGGAAHWQTAQARDDLEMATLGLDSLARSLELRVRRSVEALQSAHARLAETEASVALAEERYKNARVSFENELITRGEERAAYVGLLTARLERLAGEFAYAQGVAELAALVGDEAAGLSTVPSDVKRP
jgi:outer membrane protein TolC